MKIGNGTSGAALKNSQSAQTEQMCLLLGNRVAIKFCDFFKERLWEWFEIGKK